MKELRGSHIRSVFCRQAISDRGLPAIEATVRTQNGAAGVAVCAAGVSTGTHETPFVYDGDPQWEGKGVSMAASYAQRVLGRQLLGQDACDQAAIDRLMLDYVSAHPDEPIGGNATAALSAAALKAGAMARGMPLYRHIGGEKAVTLPLASWGCFWGSTRYKAVKKAGVKPTCAFVAYDFPSFSEATDALAAVARAWEERVFGKWRLCAAPGRAGSISAGFVLVPPGLVASDEELWREARDTIARCGFEGRVGLQLDAAADSFYDPEKGLYEGIFSASPKSRDEMIQMAELMASEYGFVIIEDPLHENDFEGHRIVTKRTGVQIVGDDLFATNALRVMRGASEGAANAVLMKVNQIGTITQALDMAETAYAHGYGVMPCNSRGEGTDIADYCVGVNAATVRESCLGHTGNRFLAIEAELGQRAVFPGKGGLKGAKFA